MKGSDSRRAKYTSDTAVDPEEASTRIVSLRMRPLQMP